MLKYTQICLSHLKAQSTLLPIQNSNVLKQQSRNTFILKRVYAPPLYKKYESKPKLTHKHFIYKLVEDTNMKHKKIDVLMIETVKNIGTKGEIVSVPFMRAYEKLILPKLAVYATPENVQKHTHEREEIMDKLPEFGSKFVERTINLLSQCCLSIQMSMDVPWTLEKWHVRVTFRRAGYTVPESAITLPQKTISGPDMSIENKEFYVIVKINNCEEVKVRCRILHHSSDPTKQIIYDPPHFMVQSTAIFPEDQSILNALPKHRLLIAENIDVDE